MAVVVLLDPDGKPLRDSKHLQRIRSLVIPPAWTDVWICPSPNGHLQAVGRDARGRKQYRYHPQYREVRDQVRADYLQDARHAANEAAYDSLARRFTVVRDDR